VPSFVPCVPEFVPYPNINSCDSVMMGCIIGRCSNPFCAKGFASIDRYEVILNRIGVFCRNTLTSRGSQVRNLHRPPI
jgi:hypothetical protein